jgi:hypothetical protein
MTRTDCWTDLPHHEPAEKPCLPEPRLPGVLEFPSVLGGPGTANACDAERLKLDIRAIDEKLHRYGLLPQLHLGCDENNMPKVIVDTANTKTDCFGYMHAPGLVPDLAPAIPLPIGRPEGPSGHCEGPEPVLIDAGRFVNQALQTAERVMTGKECLPHVDPRF